MRIWDLHPGYLDQYRLLAEHRGLHRVWNVLRDGKVGGSQNPEILRWQESPQGLQNRHNLLVQEMLLRGHNEASPLVGSFPGDRKEPKLLINNAAEQFELLSNKYGTEFSGRIPLPKNLLELWSQHKYSVLARNPTFYQNIDNSLNQSGSPLSFNELADKLTRIMQETPTEGSRMDALLQLWGYVSEFSDMQVESFATEEELYQEIQRLAIKNNVETLLHSTAISEVFFKPLGGFIDAWG